MNQILILILLAGLAFIISLVMLIVGAIKKSRYTMYTAIGIFLGSLFLAGMSVYQFASKSYYALSDFFEQPTGIDIYESFLGEDLNNCSEVLNFEQAQIPIIDYATWMHVETCPEEFERILNLDMMDSARYAEAEKWQSWFTPIDALKPDRLGSPILVFEATDDAGRGNVIYSNADSTEFYFVHYFL